MNQREVFVKGCSRMGRAGNDRSRDTGCRGRLGPAAVTSGCRLPVGDVLLRREVVGLAHVLLLVGVERLWRLLILVHLLTTLLHALHSLLHALLHASLLHASLLHASLLHALLLFTLDHAILLGGPVLVDLEVGPV